MPRLLALRETLDTVVDTDRDIGWRQINGAPDTVVERSQSLAQKAQKEAFYSNLLVHLSVETLLDYILGDSATLKIDSGADRTRSHIAERLWSEEIEPELEESVRELINAGELAWVCDLTHELAPEIQQYSSGSILGYEVLANNFRRICKLKLFPYGDQQEAILPIAGYEQPGDKRVACYVAVNKFGDTIRGMPMLSHSIDSSVIFDRANITMLARMPGLFSTWWDVTLSGFTQPRVDEWIQKNGSSIPEPGSMFAHNEQISYDVKTPGGGGSKGVDWNEFYRDLILTSSGVSPQIFTGSSYRYAETATPMYRITKRIRARLVRFLRQVVCTASGLPPSQVTITLSPSASPDLLRLTSAMDKAGNALMNAQAAGWIKPDGAGKLFRGMTKFLNGGQTETETEEN